MLKKTKKHEWLKIDLVSSNFFEIYTSKQCSGEIIIKKTKNQQVLHFHESSVNININIKNLNYTLLNIRIYTYACIYINIKLGMTKV